MQSILIVVHQAISDPGLIGQTLRASGYELDLRCPALGAELPIELHPYDGVVVFGGPMSANDDGTLPFIRSELDWIPVVLEANKPFLGVCLGAQMLARVLGARVFPHPQGVREIGYVPVQPLATPHNPFAALTHVYHWHTEGFELPQGAELLVTGDVFPHQAYRYGPCTYGVQFHPEITRAMIDLWTSKAADQLHLPGAQSYETQHHQHDRHGAQVEQWLQDFLRQWLNQAQPKAIQGRLSA